MIITYNGLNALICEGVRLIPGQNNIKDEQVFKLLRNPLFRYRVEKGLIEIPNVQNFLTDELQEAVSKDEERKKITTIDNSVSTDCIKKMIKKEKNSKVIDAAHEKIESLEQAEKIRTKKFNPLKDMNAIEPTQENGYVASVSFV